MALWVIFFVNGAVLASWAPRIPQVTADLHLTDGQVGWVLLAVAAGSVPALTGAAHLLRIVTAKSLCANTSVAFSAALPLIGLAPNGWALGGALVALGAASGCLDVAMNTAAIDYQNRGGQRILSRLHGGYSLGVLAGASSGALASMFDITVLAHFATVSTLLVVSALAASWSLPSSSTQGVAIDPDAVGHYRPTAGICSGRTLAIPASIGVMAVAALLIEGMITDWSALLVSRDFGGGATFGAVAVVAFSSSMFVSRSFGDLIVDRLGAALTVWCAAAVVSTTMLVGLLLQHQAWVAVIAVGCSGIVLGPLFPLLISEADRCSNADAAVTAARVSAIGYGAYLVGPPFVGFLAEHLSLVTSFVLISCICSIALVFASTSLRSRDKSSCQEHRSLDLLE
ncbi:MFS transporter [Rhodococcus sp. 077-4]|uniref:MFS transporter n=1 Tax=Rhodococcus sp. 077-4 TaxID=2789271 RepID=UPI0039F5A58E